MQLLQSRPKGASRRKFYVKVTVAVLGVGLLAAFFTLDSVRLKYHVWKQQRALTQAKGFLEKHDAKNAQLAIEVALTAVPGSPDAMRVAADMLEQVGAAQAMRLRLAVTQTVPDSAEDAAKLVLCCIRFRDFNAAKDALANTPHELSVQLPMVSAALAYALSTSDAPVADALFKELKTKLPDDDNLKFAHALLQMQHPDQDHRAEALRVLEALSKGNPARTLQMNRNLIGQALQRRDYAAAKPLLALVLADPSSTLNDRLQKANLDLLVDKVPFDTVFARLSPLASKNADDAVQFVQWLLVQNRAGVADGWLAGLPKELRGSAPVRAVQAAVAGQLKDWDRLGGLLEAGDWGKIPAASVRLAMAARLASEQGNLNLRHDIWNSALVAAGTNLESLGVLQRLAGLWAWDKEAEVTLWAIARAYPDQTWAHQALFNAYRSQKNTAGMREVLGALRQSNMMVPRYQNDWALLSLLLDPQLQWNLPKETMKALYERDRASATYATGYAFALAQADRKPEAKAVLDAMTAADREYPPRAPYLAYVYGVLRNHEGLARMQALMEGVDFLPEEKLLLSRARDAVDRPPDPLPPERADAAVPAKP
ncbi:MAG: hypothetical protein WC661_20225 [Opitutaceae bacterium]|jgi:hypothetical protein